MDLIDRQDAIRIVDSIDTWQAGWRGNAIESLKALPSAQPEDCDTCKHGYFGDDQCERCRVRYPSHYERRTDECTD